MSVNPIGGQIDQALVDQVVKDTAIGGADEDLGYDQDLFLKIMTAQMQNQSPFDTTDTAQIVDQQAMMAQVEQITKQTTAVTDIQDMLESELTTLNATLSEMQIALGKLADK
jgi:flagellar hook assembly protein FlgD